jgi:hypothetical protein
MLLCKMKLSYLFQGLKMTKIQTVLYDAKYTLENIKGPLLVGLHIF